MAILSKTLLLEDGIWEEIGNTAIIGQKTGRGELEIVNADDLPVGDVDESMSISDGDGLHFLPPIAGKLYIRIKHGTCRFSYYEVE